MRAARWRPWKTIPLKCVFEANRNSFSETKESVFSEPMKLPMTRLTIYFSAKDSIFLGQALMSVRSWGSGLRQPEVMQVCLEAPYFLSHRMQALTAIHIPSSPKDFGNLSLPNLTCLADGKFSSRMSARGSALPARRGCLACLHSLRITERAETMCLAHLPSSETLPLSKIKEVLPAVAVVSMSLATASINATVTGGDPACGPGFIWLSPLVTVDNSSFDHWVFYISLDQLNL